MYISNLHINGFKSFMTKTDLKFGEGITTVVGPNGCGKTNIVDAIRWILGEHKNSLLRSTRMEDVIFNGTKTRKPLGFCEVSLSIHNNRGVLPVEYTDVEVTRRLFRSGESEYLLNKVPCRLKDIYELFVDTGMGAHAYSVIELNMIDSILSYNPEDRRKMFEEAAGVNHYKQQRGSTYRQLDSTLMDLDRVNDIISEVEDKVNHLRLQLKRFERHKSLVENLKNSEIYLSQIQIQILREKNNPVASRLQALKSSYSSIAGQLSFDEALIGNVQKKFELQKSLFIEVNQRSSEIEKNLREINDNILISTEKVKSSESRLLQYGDEMKIAEGRIQTLTEQINEIDSKIQDIQPQITTYESNYVEKNSQLTQVNDQLRNKSTEFQRIRANIDNASKLLYKNEARFSQIKKSVEEKNVSIDKILTQKSAMLDKVGNFDFDINEKTSQISGQEKKNNTISFEFEEMREKRLAVEDELLSLREKKLSVQSQLKSEQSRFQFYTDILQKFEGQTDGAKYILSNPSVFKGVLGPVIDLVDTEEKYRRAIESGLGESTNYLIVDTYKNAISIIETIRKTQDLSIYLIPLDRIPVTDDHNEKFPSGLFADTVINCESKFKNLFKFLLREKLIVESLGDIRKELSDKYDIITLNGDQYRKDSLIKVNSKKNIASIGRRKQIEDIKKKISTLTDAEKHLLSDTSEKEKSANQLREIIKHKSLDLDSGIKSLQALESKRSEIIFQQKHAQSVLVNLDKEISDTKNKILELSSEHEDIRSKIENSKVVIKENTHKHKLSESEINELRISYSKIQQEVQDARVKMIEIKKEIEGLEFRFKSGSDQISELEARKNFISLEQVKSTEFINKLSNELSKAQENKQNLTLLQEDQLKEKNKIEIEYNQSLEELQEVQRTVRDQQKVKEKNMLEIQNYEIQIVESTKEIEIIQRRINDIYDCEVPNELLDLSDVDPSDISSSIDSVNRSIQKIGPINMEVKNEYENESNRLTFLQQQLKDLIDSEHTLRDTINRIDGEARNQFMQTFEEIRKNFKITYTKFFSGGEADIRLIGDDDPLESDISIIAKPPGKRTQTLRMLSAGEKSLTAIALLFAIYLVKPSPFCILDEVDAPLDDINIKKFTDVLSEFSDKTQFIVVTHNKLTMEASDFLYGITQEEEGVSKVVSVKFKDDHDTAAVA